MQKKTKANVEQAVEAKATTAAGPKNIYPVFKGFAKKVSKKEFERIVKSFEGKHEGCID
jgi:hypothetical protein